jgi:hypothetical protein
MIKSRQGSTKGETVVQGRPDSRDSDQPVQLHTRAMDNLAYIRDTMAKSSEFTAVSGWGVIAMGVIALLGSYVASLRLTHDWWLYIWVVVAITACSTGVLAMVLKARRTSAPMLTGPGRRFLLSFSPPILAGCVIGEQFYELDLQHLFPGMWLLLYGVGVITGGTFSVRAIPLMGLCFMVLGAVTFLLPNSEIPVLFGNLQVPDVLMAVGFGGLHVVFGIIIVEKYGG